MLVVNSRLQVPLREFRFTFARSPGPGGQNVNKVNTAVRLLYDYARSSFLTDGQKALLSAVATRTRDGESVIVVEADTHRTQGMNRALALRKLQDIVDRALEPPPPERVVVTGLPASARAVRAKRKRRRGAVKASRRDTFEEEWE